MMKRLLVAVVVMLSSRAFAQEGMTWNDFLPRLQDTYGSEMIGDIRSALPDPATFKIWGYDAGDFSSDGYADCALSLQILHEGGRRMHVFLFVDDMGMLKLVGSFTRPYITLPIEVGINILHGSCSVVSKISDTRWETIGYRYRFGDLIVADSFVRDFTNPTAFDRERHFSSLRATERFYNFNTDSTYLRTSCLVLPSYRRGHLPFPNVPFAAVDSTVDYVVNGSYYWAGRHDCGMTTQTAYDEDYLYFLVRVTDDQVVTSAQEPANNDHIDLWLDATIKNRLSRSDTKSLTFRTRADSNIYDFTISPGNFLEKKPKIKLASSQQFSEDQYSAMKGLKVVSRKTPEGYLVKVRIPFAVIGLESAPVENDLATIGCTVLVHDIDNEYRPEESTTVATSDFDQRNPTSFGELILLPLDRVYGTVQNIYIDNVLERISAVGH